MLLVYFALNNATSGGHAFYANNSIVSMLDVTFGDSKPNDVVLHNSERRVGSWNVNFENAQSESSLNCSGKCDKYLCPAANNNCTDCYNCIQFGPKAVCADSDFNCYNGACGSVRNKETLCKCNPGYEGKYCFARPSPFPYRLVALICGVVCGVAIVGAIVIIVYRRRRRQQYTKVNS